MVSYTNSDLTRFNGKILFPGIILIRPPKSTQLTSNIVLFDDQIKLVLDAGGFQWGNSRTVAIRDFFGIDSNDILLLSHYHLDHIMGCQVFSKSQKLIHSSEEDVLKSMENFFRFCLGEKATTPQYEDIWKPMFLNFFKQEELSEWADLALENIQPINAGHALELGEKTLEILHLPGHSPGHCGVYEPESKILFIGDIDVGLRFGPWYGWANSDLGTFRKTIGKLKEFIESNEIAVVVPSHSEPIKKEECLKRLKQFSMIFNERKQKIFEFISNQKDGTTMGELVSQSVIHQGKEIHFWEVFEQFMIEKHLKELEIEKSVYYEGDRINSAT